MPPPTRHLLLVGGGHSHLFVLEALAARPPAGCRLTLVSPAPLATYSGMVPGTLAGQYPLRAAQIDVARLAARAGVTYRRGRAVRIDAAARTLHLDDGNALPYDVLSLDVGSRTAPPPDVGPGAALVKVRPIEAAIDSIDAALGAAIRAVVVGAGAGGCEIVFALAARLRGRGGTVTLCERSSRPLAERGARTAGLVERALAAAGIRLVAEAEAARVDASGVHLRGGARLPAELVVWSTGAVGPPLFRDSGLPVDRRGCLLVGADLRCPAHPEVFAAGDCATLAAHPELPKAGVFAVRQGPLLARNLLAALGGEGMRPFRPQRRFLALLNTADGRAIASYGAAAWHGRPAWWLKDWIDRRFVRRFDRR